MGQEQAKKLERKVKYLLDTKEIPPPIMDAVHTLMKNDDLLREERAGAIISLLENCKDKRPTVIPKVKVKEKVKNSLRVKPKIVHKKSKRETFDGQNDIHPTHTSYYVDRLYKEYKKSQLFVKKYIIREDNRIGFSIRKRLVPSKKLLKLLKQIFVLQRECASKLLLGMDNLLEDTNVENPLLFNYLKILNSWLSIEPLSSIKSSDIIHLDRDVFDKEFSEWISGYYLMQEITPSDREFIFKGLNTRLQNIVEYKKDTIYSDDSDYAKSEKNRRNQEIDKKLLEIRNNLRSFLHGDNEETLLSSMIQLEYDVSGLRELTLMILRALVYQRFVKQNEFYKRYDVTAPTVIRDHWDYPKDILKKFGKDDDSKKQRELAVFEKKFESLDLVFKILRLKQSGESLLFDGASLQLKLIDKNRNLPNLVFDSNSIYYMECILQYFKNVFVQLIDGSTLSMRDSKRNSIEVNIFEPDLFSDMCSQLEGAVNKLDKFKSEHTTLSISKTELQKIFDGQIKTMDNLKSIIYDIGIVFYNIGSTLKNLYEVHLQWKKAGEPTGRFNFKEGDPIPIPFHDCRIESLPLKNSLSDRIVGKVFVGSGYSDGVFGNMMTYCYQVAQLCSNEYLKNDLYERETLMSLIKQLKMR